MVAVRDARGAREGGAAVGVFSDEALGSNFPRQMDQEGSGGLLWRKTSPFRRK